MECRRSDQHHGPRLASTRGFALAVMVLAVALASLMLAAAARPFASTALALTTTEPPTSISVDCDGNGDLAGSISNIAGPFPVVFDVFVTDHIPGESGFVEIPGSRVTVSATSSTVSYGPLDTSQHRAGINTMRVETTLSNEKSRSLLCESPPPTSTPTHTPVPPTHTPVPPTSTPATATPAGTSTSITPTGTAGASGGTPATSSGGSPSPAPTLVSTVLPSTLNRTSSSPTGVTLPSTGAPASRGRADTDTVRALAAAALVAGGLALAMGLRRRTAG